MRRMKTIIGIVLIFGLLLSVSLAFAGGEFGKLGFSSKMSSDKRGFAKAGLNLNISSAIASILGITQDDIQKAIQSGKTFSDIIKEKGLTLDEFKKKLLDKINSTIDDAVKNNKITSQKADQLKQDIKQKIDSWDGRTPFFGMRLKGAYKGLQELDMMSDIATILGTTKDQLLNELKNGKTLQDLLKAKNLSTEDFKSKLISMQTAKIDKLVTDGKITKDQAEKLKENIKTKINNWDLSKGFGKGSRSGCGMGFGKAKGFGGRFRGSQNGQNQNSNENSNTNSSSTNLNF